MLPLKPLRRGYAKALVSDGLALGNGGIRISGERVRYRSDP